MSETIEFVFDIGAKPILAEFSPIPQTKLWKEAKENSKYDLENEPLFHNNTILPCQHTGFTADDYQRLKLMTRMKYTVQRL